MGFLEAAKFLKLVESRSGDSLDEERPSRNFLLPPISFPIFNLDLSEDL